MIFVLKTKLHMLYVCAFLVVSLQAWTPAPSLRSVSSSSTLKSAVSDENPNKHEDSSPSFENSNGDNISPAKNITQLVEHKLRLAKAQAEIDRILNDPIDPPFDMEQELKKVVSISPPLVSEDSLEYELEENLSKTEAELFEAVKQQDYVKASKKSATISQQHIDDCGAVLQANSMFYRAFSTKSLEDMERLWLPDRSCVCIHPASTPLMGSHAILQSWKQMFQTSVGSKNWMEPLDIKLSVKATTAVVTCEQDVYSRRFIRGQKRKTELVNKLQATNIFRKVGGKWYMTYHHSSWHKDSQAAKLGLGGGASLADQKQVKASPRIRNDDDSSSSTLETILGINSGPLLGDGPSSSDKNNEQRPKRIIMGGSLSDILNGGLLGDILGDAPDSGGAPGNPGQNDDDDATGTIISFNRIEEVDGDDDDDRDNDNDDDDDIEETSSIDVLKPSRKSKASSSSSTTTFVDRKKPNLRQDCIDMLRKLADQGRISPKQKRVLLTDIIQCSARGDVSMVEVAYELLCVDNTNMEEAKTTNEDETGNSEEEFAEQCLVFYESMVTDPTSSNNNNLMSPF